MNILAIETSCDDTCAAVIEAKGEKNLHFKILSNVISSQAEIHQKYGGVYPTLAKREHQKNLPMVLKKALRQAQGKQIELIAVTIGPGLEPCLWTGVNFAKALSYSRELPIVPVNHIEAHILANWLPPIRSNLKSRIPNSKKLFPAICLVVSGGHTQLILMKDFGEYKILGETRDDAAGECFDKVARILGLGYPGGPIISKMAKKRNNGSRTSIILPRPMIYQKNYDFSFSGLKTAVLYLVKQLMTNNQQLTVKQKREICAETQQAVIDVLIYKTLKAAKAYKVKSIILGGGVAANKELRKQFKKACLKWKFKYSVPSKILCTDNAAMAGITAYYCRQKGKTKNWRNIEVNANLKIT